MRSTWVWVVLAVFSVAAGCGDDDGGSTPPDAAPVADAGPPDAAVPADLWFVMDQVQVPETANQATTFALDLDGNGQPDNALGGLLAALHGQTGMPIAAAHMQAIDTGRALTLVGLEDVILEEGGSVPVRVVPGEDLDDDPADNFSGTEPFALAPVEGIDGELAGTLVGAGLSAGPGTVPVLLTVNGDPDAVIALVGVGGRIDAEASGIGLGSGLLGAAFTEDEVDTRLLPAMATGIDAILLRDCPEGVCQPGSPGEELAIFFDDNGDFRVTEEEFRASALISSTVGNPDLDLFDENGDFNPRMDGVKESLSFGVRLTAVPAVLAE
jgi:hypothetical protein